MTVEPSLFFRRVVLRYIPTIMPFTTGHINKKHEKRLPATFGSFQERRTTNPYGYYRLHPRHPLYMCLQTRSLSQSWGDASRSLFLEKNRDW